MNEIRGEQSEAEQTKQQETEPILETNELKTETELPPEIEKPKDTEKQIEVEKEIESILVKEEPGIDYDISSIDFSVFGDAEESIRKICDDLAEWLKIPYVYDKFGDDNEARYAWRDGMGEKYGSVFGKKFGKLRKGNKFYDAIHSSQSLKLFTLSALLEKNNFNDLVRQIRDVLNEIKVGDIPKDNVEERRKSIGQLEKRVVATLDLLAIYTQKNKK